MLTRPISIDFEETKGDGNCAFNAFLLNLIRSEVLSYLLKELIKQKESHPLLPLLRQISQEMLGYIPTDFNEYEFLFAELIHLKNSDPERLQVKFAPLARHFAITLAAADPSHKINSLPAFLSASREYIYELAGIVANTAPMQADDIYTVHEFIKKELNPLGNNFISELQREFTQTELEEYKRLCKTATIQDEKNKLSAYQNRAEKVYEIFNQTSLDWWNASGYQEFLTQMQVNGVHAGCLELVPLAKAAQVNLEVKRFESTINLHVENGSMPRNEHLTADDLKELASRQVIFPAEDDATILNLLPNTTDELASRLEVVPEFPTVSSFIEPYLNDGSLDLKTQTVPASFSADTVTELKNRDVVNAHGNFIVSAVDAHERSQAFTKVNAATIVACHKVAPTLSLRNDTASHWSSIKFPTLPNIFKFKPTKVEKPKEQVVPKPNLFAAAKISKPIARNVVTETKPAVIATASPEAETIRSPAFISYLQQNKWEEILNKAKDLPEVALDAATPTITYTFKVAKNNLEETIEKKVSRDQQIQYDSEYARKLQLEEINGSSEEDTVKTPRFGR